jgi:hypothetical protein
MDEQFEFYYLIISEVQLGLDGKEYPKDVIYEGHILHSGRPMCGESMEVLKNRVKTKCAAETVKEKTQKVRVGTKICKTCQDKYRKNGRSQWTAWVEGKPKTPKVREVIHPHAKQA